MGTVQDDTILVTNTVLQNSSSLNSEERSDPVLNPSVPRRSINDVILKKVHSKRLRNILSSIPFDMWALTGFGVFISVAIAIAIPVVCLTEPKNTNATATNSSGTTTIDALSLRWMTKGTTVAGVSSENSIDIKRLSFCTGMALDSSNTIYVADYENNRIQKWIQNAQRAVTIGSQSGNEQNSTLDTLKFPTKVAVDLTGNIYVTDSENHRIQFWSGSTSSSKTVAGKGVAGAGSDELNTPWGIALDFKSNTFYIADSNNNRVMQYRSGSRNGTLVAGGNGPGKGASQLFLPRGLYFDSTSNSLIITNFACNNIVRWVLGDNHWTLLAGSINAAWGSDSTLLYYPSDITLDSFGNLYVADTYNHRIQFFIAGQTNATTIAGVTGKPDVSPISLNYPSSVAVDSQLSLYVADSGNYRIQRYLRS